MGYEYPTHFTSWGDEEREAIQRVIASDRWTMGPEVESFEAELAAHMGTDHAIMVNSGSSANLVAVRALIEAGQLSRGDRVVVPALAWPTLYSPLVLNNLRLLVADCDPGTWNVNEFPALAGANDIAAFVSCSVLGMPANVSPIKAACEKASVLLMEDACESLGAVHNGKSIGTLGHIGTVSFYYSHQLSAVEGGAVLTTNGHLARLCRMIRNHGWTRGTDLQKGTFAGEYEFHLHGFNLRPVEMHAAIAREQLKKLTGFKRHRAANWLEFFGRTQGLPIKLQHMGYGEMSPFGFAFTVKDAPTRARLATALRAASVDCRPPVGGSFGKHPYSKHANWTGETPNADHIHECGLFLGLAPHGMSHLIEKAAKVMEKVLA